MDTLNYRRTEIVSIGDRVFPGYFFLHSRFKRVINFTDGESIVALVDERIGQGPVNIVFKDLDLVKANTLAIDEETITLNNAKFHFDRKKIFDSRIEAETVDAERLAENLISFEKTLRVLSPPKSLAFLLDAGREANFTSSFEKEFLKRVKDALGAIFDGKLLPEKSRVNLCNLWLITGRGRFLSGIKNLKGTGLGLTPSGDDFIAGLLAALNLTEKICGVDLRELRERTVKAAKGSNLLSNSFLALAGEGFFFEGFKELLLSLLYENKNQITRKTEKLLSLGETSGSDMGVGFLLTMQETTNSNFQAPNPK